MAVKDVESLAARMEKQKSKRQTTDVSEIASGIVSEDSKLMQAAATQGRQYGNSRGLLNSSIAAGAGMDAALNYAVPMAQQTAQQRHATYMQEDQAGFASALSDQDFRQNTKLSAQQFEQASSLSDQEFQQQMGMSREQYRQNLEIQSRDQSFQRALSEQEFRQASSLSDQEFEQQMGLSREEYRQNLEIQSRDQSFQRGENTRALVTEQANLRMQLASQEQLARLDANTRQQLMQMESDMRERLAQMDVDTQTRSAVSDMVTSVNSQYQNALNSILANPNMPANERNALLAASGELLNHQMTMIEGLYGTEFNWIDDAFDISGSTNSGGSNTSQPANTTSNNSTTTETRTGDDR